MPGDPAAHPVPITDASHGWWFWASPCLPSPPLPPHAQYGRPLATLTHPATEACTEVLEMGIPVTGSTSSSKVASAIIALVLASLLRGGATAMMPRLDDAAVRALDAATRPRHNEKVASILQ